jgi:hypothetical protein
MGTLIRNRKNRVACIMLGAVALLAGGVPMAVAQVPICQALTLYGNAVKTGLCQGLSTGTQNLWVCELTSGAPDVHSTFNSTTPFHVTVRTQSCDAASVITGTWPNSLRIAAQQPTTVCNVGIQNYVTRFNNVPQVPAGPATRCRAAFTAAAVAGKITQSVEASYLHLCSVNNCP